MTAPALDPVAVASAYRAAVAEREAKRAAQVAYYAQRQAYRDANRAAILEAAQAVADASEARFIALDKDHGGYGVELRANDTSGHLLSIYPKDTESPIGYSSHYGGGPTVDYVSVAEVVAAFVGFAAREVVRE